MTNYLKRTVKLNQALAYSGLSIACRYSTLGPKVTMAATRRVMGREDRTTAEQMIDNTQKFFDNKMKHKFCRAFFGREATARIEGTAEEENATDTDSYSI